MPVMLGHAIVCFVIILLFDASRISSALKLRDLSRLIENVQRNEAKYNNEKDHQSQALDKNNGYFAISSQELDEIINNAATDVYNRNENKSKKRYLKFKDGRNVAVPKIENLSQLLSSQKVQRNPIRDVLSKLSKVNSFDLGSENRVLFEDSDSKVYLILDPQADLNKKDIREISDMLSQILSDSSSKGLYSQHDHIKRKQRYKGFPIAERSLARRRNRASKELYSPQDSLEEYKPKRGRGDYGGSGGRTPIPYIRHRDIYERD